MAILVECPTCHRKQSAKNRICTCGEDLVRAKRSQRVKYWISYWLPRRKQRREPVGYSIKEAQDAEGKRRSQKREHRIFDIKPETKMTFQELADWYLGLEKVKALASYWRVKLSLKKFNSEFGDVIVSQIKPADLENYQAKRKGEGRADNTIDHEVSAAKAVVLKAFDNDLVGGDTLKNFKKVKRMLKRKANVRNKVLTLNEFYRLLEHSPQHIRAILLTGFHTGMRLGEILNLTWDRVDLKRHFIYLEATDTKDREPRGIPICNELYEALNALPRAIHDPHVFLYRGKPIKSINTRSLKAACERAGVPYGRFTRNGFVFHDLRHTFNTYMRKAGVPESVIMAITGHATREMFDRYNRIDQDDTRQAVDQMQAFLKSIDQSVDQVKK